LCQKRLRLSCKVDECKPLDVGDAPQLAELAKEWRRRPKRRRM